MTCLRVIFQDLNLRGTERLLMRPGDFNVWFMFRGVLFTPVRILTARLPPSGDGLRGRALKSGSL